MPLSTTPGGQAFAIKSLHPAEATIKTARVPGSTQPTVAIACDMVDTIQFPAGANNAVLTQWPQMSHPASLVFYDASGNYVDHYIWANKALGAQAAPIHAPTTWASLMFGLSDLSSKFQAYRVVAQSVTVDVVAPSLSNQGTIVSAQYDTYPLTCSPSAYTETSGGVLSQVKIGCDIWAYRRNPDSGEMLMGTSAYTAKATEGVYQPLKIGNFKWRNVNDQFMPVTDVSGDIVQVAVSAIAGNNPIYFNGLPFVYGTNTIVKPTSNIAGITYIEGTAGNPNVSLRIRFRQVCEVIPRLGSVYAPLAEAPLPPDDLSIRMVKEISARMKDAYPASYNDVGKLKDTIVKIGRGILRYADPVLDVLGLVPGMGSIASGAKMAARLAQGVDTMLNSTSKAARKQARQQVRADANAVVRAGVKAAKRAAKRKRQRKSRAARPRSGSI